MTTIERLRALEKAATEAPWEVAWHASRKPIATSESTHADADGKPFGLYGATMVPTRTDVDLELCAATRNALPAMLAVIEAAEEVRAATKDFRATTESLARYGAATAALDTALAAFREVRE